MLVSILGKVMKLFYDLTNNYGIAIILFTIFSKIIILPFSILVQKNSIKLISLKPKMNKIKIDNFGNDDKIIELQSDLYKKEKYNPFISAIPVILQLIILIVLITIVNNPITYITNIDNNTKENLIKETKSVKYQELEVIKKVKTGELKNKEINNLNLSIFNYDLTEISAETNNYTFPVIAALSALLYCYIAAKENVLQKEESLAYNLITTIISVLLSLYLGLYVPTGVALYWIISNLLAIIQLILLNIFINPKKYINYNELEKTNKKLKELAIDNRKKEQVKKEKEDYKRFFSIDNKHFVIYGESKSYYKYFKGIIEYLLKNSNLTIHYITSDYNDEVLNKKDNNFKSYYIGEKKLIPLMMKMDSDIVLTTTPDLDNYHIKKSYVKKDIEYIFLPHGIGNHNLFGKKASLNNFDTVFALDKYQKEETKAVDKAYNINRKVVELGYPLLDEMIKKYKEKESKIITIAPSWQENSIMDNNLDILIDKLKDYQIIIRPHPYYLKHNIDKINNLKNKYKNIKIENDYTNINKIFDSCLLITDWSAISYEYAYTTKKPVIFINTPMKVINKDYKEVDIDIFELSSRSIIGKEVELEELKDIDKIVKEVLKNKKNYSKKIDKFFKENVYNIGSSSKIGAKYIVNSIKEKIDRRTND